MEIVKLETIKCKHGTQCVWINAVNPYDKHEIVYANTSTKFICNFLHPKESVRKMLERTGVCDTVH